MKAPGRPIFFLILFIAGLFLSCKKDPPPPPAYLPEMSKGRLLSYYDDAPIADATITLYYTNGIPFETDMVVTTDSDGYFTYKNLKDTIVTAIPSKTGWWCPFEYGYGLNNKSDAFENDSIIYLFHQASVQVTMHVQTPIAAPFTGKIKIEGIARLSKLNPTNIPFQVSEWKISANDTGTWTTHLETVAEYDNVLWFSMEQYVFWSYNTINYQIHDSISFYADTTSTEPKFDFYY